MNPFRVLTVLLTLFFLAACDAPVPEPSTAVGESPASAEMPATAPAEAGIDWFEGSVEDAFALAQKENKPLFLYWGAVWCPPCVEIRNTVFKSQRFIGQSRQFIPVYLDGDTERAQVWGDRFDTKVYPTMIVFSPGGEEVMRLNAGIDISDYNDVLEISLEQMRPIAELARSAMWTPASLVEADFMQLAYYSWYDDKALPDDAPVDFFLRLSEAAAEFSPAASARLYLQHATQAVSEGQKADPDRVSAILSDPDLLFASWDYLIAPEQIMPNLAGDEARLAGLKSLWAETMRQKRHDDRLTVKNRLYGWRPYLVFHFEGDPEKSRPLPTDVIDAIRADGRAATDSLGGMHTRQSVINTLSNVYVLAGMNDDARILLQEEIGQSKTPYYFMGSLASLEEGEGNTVAALDWRQKAYKTSEGPATRIRWWASYVQALTRLAPADDETILDVAMYPFAPEQGMKDLYSGANYRNLQRAVSSLEAWEDGNGRLESFREALRQYCEAAGEGCKDVFQQ